MSIETIKLPVYTQRITKNSRVHSGRSTCDLQLYNGNTMDKFHESSPMHKIPDS